jgi:hypothetical protein
LNNSIKLLKILTRYLLDLGGTTFGAGRGRQVSYLNFVFGGLNWSSRSYNGFVQPKLEWGKWVCVPTYVGDKLENALKKGG